MHILGWIVAVLMGGACFVVWQMGDQQRTEQRQRLEKLEEQQRGLETLKKTKDTEVAKLREELEKIKTDVADKTAEKEALETERAELEGALRKAADAATAAANAAPTPTDEGPAAAPVERPIAPPAASVERMRDEIENVEKSVALLKKALDALK